MEIINETANSIREGRYIMIDGRPCEVVAIDKSAPGKHGHAKLRITGLDILTGAKKMGLWTAHDKVEVPIIEKKTAQVLSVSGDKAQVMDMQSYETFDVAIPPEFKDRVVANAEVTYWEIMNDKVIREVKKA